VVYHVAHGTKEGPVTLANARGVTLIPIRNMNRALKFYTRALGGQLRYRGRGEMRDAWASVQVARQELWLIVPQTREPRKLAYSAFLVKNIKSAVRRLQRNRVKFERAEKMGPESRIEGPITFDSFGASAFFKDTEGNLFMLWQSFPPM
jgi:predicted enzyme related to lactoylglutathione lyase